MSNSNQRRSSLKLAPVMSTDESEEEVKQQTVEPPIIKSVWGKSTLHLKGPQPSLSPVMMTDEESNNNNSRKMNGHSSSCGGVIVPSPTHSSSSIESPFSSHSNGHSSSHSSPSTTPPRRAPTVNKDSFQARAAVASLLQASSQQRIRPKSATMNKSPTNATTTTTGNGTGTVSGSTSTWTAPIQSAISTALQQSEMNGKVKTTTSSSTPATVIPSTSSPQHQPPRKKSPEPPVRSHVNSIISTPAHTSSFKPVLPTAVPTAPTTAPTLRASDQQKQQQQTQPSQSSPRHSQPSSPLNSSYPSLPSTTAASSAALTRQSPQMNYVKAVLKTALSNSSSNRHSANSSAHSSRAQTPTSSYGTHSSPDYTPRGEGAQSPSSHHFTRSAPASPAMTRANKLAQRQLKLNEEEQIRRGAESLRTSKESLDEMDESADSWAISSDHDQPFSLKRAASSPNVTRPLSARVHRTCSPDHFHSHHHLQQPQSHSLNASFDRKRAQDDSNHRMDVDEDEVEEEEEEEQKDDGEEEHEQTITDEEHSPTHHLHRHRPPITFEDDIESPIGSDVEDEEHEEDVRESSYLDSMSDDQQVHDSSDGDLSTSEIDEAEMMITPTKHSKGVIRVAPIQLRETPRSAKRHSGSQPHPQHHHHDRPLAGASTTASISSTSSRPLSASSTPSAGGSPNSTLNSTSAPVAQSGTLHEQILEICAMMGPKPADDLARKTVSKRVSEKVWELWPDAEVHIIGSCATNLFLPDSDIDLVIRNQKGKPKLDVKDLFFLGEHLTPLSSSINIISTASVPLIKLVDKLTNYTVDITLNVETGLYSTSFVIQQLDLYPDVLYRLTIVLKQYLKAKNLNDLYSGGLPSYTLILMIVSFLQHHPQEQQRQRSRRSSLEEEKAQTTTPPVQTPTKRQPSTLESIIASPSSRSTNHIPSPMSDSAAAVAEYADWTSRELSDITGSTVNGGCTMSALSPTNIQLRTQLRKGGDGELIKILAPPKKSSVSYVAAASGSTSTTPTNESTTASSSKESSTTVSAPTPIRLDPATVDLGEYLLAFLKLYSLDFDYDTLGISLMTGYFSKASRGWLHAHNPHLLCLENPMDPTIDLGFKVFNYPAIKSAFLDAYQTLSSGKAFTAGASTPTSSAPNTPPNSAPMEQLSLNQLQSSQQQQQLMHSLSAPPSLPGPGSTNVVYPQAAAISYPSNLSYSNGGGSHPSSTTHSPYLQQPTHHLVPIPQLSLLQPVAISSNGLLYPTATVSANGSSPSFELDLASQTLLLQHAANNGLLPLPTTSQPYFQQTANGTYVPSSHILITPSSMQHLSSTSATPTNSSNHKPNYQSSSNGSTHTSSNPRSNSHGHHPTMNGKHHLQNGKPYSSSHNYKQQQHVQ